MPENCAKVVHRITKKHEDDLCLFMKYELTYFKKNKERRTIFCYRLSMFNWISLFDFVLWEELQENLVDLR